MSFTLQGLAPGTYEGRGINHEKQAFLGVLVISPRCGDKGLTVDFSATGDDGTVYHREHSLLSRAPDGTPALWVMSTNHPGVVEHRLVAGAPAAGAATTHHFRVGDVDDQRSFRETVAIDVWPNGDLSYRYAWGLPGGAYAERSGARMTPGARRPVPEARLRETTTGVVPEGDGWYVLNAKDARWHTNGKFGASVNFEGSHRFAQYGINIHVLDPGQPNCHYHGEDDQEDFLVLSGQCKLLIEGEERLLRPWDFVHCPKWARHVFVGAGEGPCAILMTGGRTGTGVIYPTPPLARAYDATPAAETASPTESYAACPKWSEASFRALPNQSFLGTAET